jgi:hypothetical protein
MPALTSSPTRAAPGAVAPPLPESARTLQLGCTWTRCVDSRRGRIRRRFARAHEFPAKIGPTLDEAVTFVARLAPPVVALEQADPDKFAELKAAMAARFARFEGPDGVATPSASWIVTAMRD